MCMQLILILSCNSAKLPIGNFTVTLAGRAGIGQWALSSWARGCFSFFYACAEPAEQVAGVALGSARSSSGSSPRCRTSSRRRLLRPRALQLEPDGHCNGAPVQQHTQPAGERQQPILHELLHCCLLHWCSVLREGPIPLHDWLYNVMQFGCSNHARPGRRD